MRKNRKLRILTAIAVLLAIIFASARIYKSASPVKVFSDSLLGISFKNEFEGWHLYANCAEEMDELWIAEHERAPRRTLRIAFIGETEFSKEKMQEMLGMILGMVQEYSDKHNCRQWQTSNSIEVFFCMEDAVYGVYVSKYQIDTERETFRLKYRDWIEVLCAEESLTLNAVKRLMEIPEEPMYWDYEALVEGKEPGVFRKVMSE